MEEANKMKRRDFMRLSAVAALATVAAACQPAAAPTAAPGGEPDEATTAPETGPAEGEAPEAVTWTGEIEFYAQAYTPSSVLVNPDPDAPKREAMEVLANEWMDLHPGIDFKFINAPSGDYPSWLNTQLIGGTGPDVFWIHLGTLNQMADEGKVVPMNDYLELPNKYTPEDTMPWKETFKSPFMTTFSPKGQWGGVPMDLVSTGVYCNNNMFEEVGIDLASGIVPELGSPDSWATLIEWCQKFRDAGYWAFSSSGYILEWWLQGVLGDQLFWDQTEQFDKLNYHEQTPIEFQENLVSKEEIFMQYYCADYKPFEDPRMREMFLIFKELTQYMPEGFVDTSTMWDAPWEYYLQGQLAMFWDGSWRVGSIMQDTRREFEFSSFWLPPITKETSEFANDTPILPIGVGGYGSLAYGINRKCIAKGNVDPCVDWLMFITTPENDEYVVNEVPSFIPANKKAKSLPEVENLFVGETRLVAGAGHPWPAPLDWFSYQESKYTDAFKRELTLYLLGEQELDAFMGNMATEAATAAPAVMRAAAVQYSDDGDWDLTQWDCEPQV